MKTLWIPVLCGGIAVLVWGQEARQDEDLSAVLKEVMEANMQALRKEEVKGAMSAIHSKSPMYEQTESLMERLFEEYDLQYRLLSCTYLGTDGEYAVARVKQETKRIKGPEFRNNTADTVQIFRKENNSWKIWQTAIIQIDFAR